jgi:signal transduction histidine kinase
MNEKRPLNRRILLIDDNQNIHEDFRTILERRQDSSAALAEEEAALFGQAAPPPDQEGFETDSAFQGQEGVEKLRQAVAEGRPYALAFVDMRMPPGWDGVTTIQELWKVYPDLEVVICTAYSDHSWSSIVEALGRTDKLLILKKPCDNVEVLQLATALTEKWTLTQEARLRREELEQKVAERTEELRVANKELQKETCVCKEALNSLTREVVERRKAEERLARAHRELQDFVYTIAHDLKAPTGGIQTVLQLILSECPDALGQETKEQIHLVSSRVRRMRNLIDGMMEYADSAGPESEKTLIDMNAVVEEVIKSVAPPPSIRITVDDELPKILFPRARAFHILQNLVANAVEYIDKPRGFVRIGCTGENGFWKFSVSDNGPGIEEKDLDRVFRAFQVGAKQGAYERVGLGLTLVSKIIDAGGGQIWVESKVGTGTTFWFTIPRDSAGVGDGRVETDLADRG